jgi:hypothetical protein
VVRREAGVAAVAEVVGDIYILQCGLSFQFVVKSNTL